MQQTPGTVTVPFPPLKPIKIKDIKRKSNCYIVISAKGFLLDSYICDQIKYTWEVANTFLNQRVSIS